MILVWDNGQSYSSHALFLIDVGNDLVLAEHRASLLESRCVERRKVRPHFTAHVVCLVEAVVWYAGGPLPWEQFKLPENSVYELHCEDCLFEGCTCAVKDWP